MDEPADIEMKEDEEDKPNVKSENDCLSDANLLNEGDHEAVGKSDKRGQKTLLTPVPSSRVAGHTGFLTVATKL